jgi:hypothetical protein
MLAAELVLELSVDIGEILDIGQTARGHLRVIPIIGGTFTGKAIRGIVVPGGADWNTQMGNGISHVFAKYTLRTDDGSYISVQNEGYLQDNLLDALIKTTPQFQADENGKYHWLSQGVYAGSLRGREGGIPGVLIQIFKLA